MFINILEKRKPEFEALKAKYPISKKDSKDKYPQYFTKEVFIEQQEQTRDITLEKDGDKPKYGFHGDWTRWGHMEITTIIQGAPADKAGLQVGDKIDKVNSQKKEHLTGEEWAGRMKDSKQVTLQVRQNVRVPTRISHQETNDKTKDNKQEHTADNNWEESWDEIFRQEEAAQNQSGNYENWETKTNKINKAKNPSTKAKTIKARPATKNLTSNVLEL